MKTQQEIEKSLIQIFVSLQNKVTNFVIGSVARSIFTSVASSLSELWAELVIVKRSLFWSTASGTALTALMEDNGMPSLSAISATAVLVFKGDVYQGTGTGESGGMTGIDTVLTAGLFATGTWYLKDSLGATFKTVNNTTSAITIDGTETPQSGAFYVLPAVPAATTVRSAISQTAYVTTAELIVGLNNPSLNPQSNASSLGNAVTAICSVVGDQGSANADEITSMSAALPGIVSVTNPVPTQPRTGLSAETDNAIRQRHYDGLAILNQGTQGFFNAIARLGNAKILKAIAQKSTSVGADITVHCATLNGATLTAPEKTALKTYIEDRTRSFDTVAVVDMVMTDLTIAFSTTLLPTTTLAIAYTKAATAIANFVDYAAWDYTKDVVDDDLLALILAIPDFADVDLTSFALSAFKAGDAAGTKRIVLSNSLPRFARLAITDTTAGLPGTTLDIALNQMAIQTTTDAEQQYINIILA